MSTNINNLKEEKATNNEEYIPTLKNINTNKSMNISNTKQEEINHCPTSLTDKITENSVKHKESSFSFKQPKDYSLTSDYKLSSFSNTQNYPNSNTHQQNKTTLIGEHNIKKPEPIQIGNINMNVNNYYSYFVDSSTETIKKRLIESKKKKKFNCSCKKSQCLKLYCDCFANEEFCVDCNCQGCSNIIGNETKITKVFNEVKDKNPIAMKFNINEEATALGCNCTKSNCLKKYCECFKAKLFCTELCRCRDCDNCTHNINEIKKSNNYNSKSPLKNIYDKFSFEKISVMIDKQQIHIQKDEHISSDHFLPNKQKDQVLVRIKNHQTFIEIPKSLINIADEDYNILFNRKEMKDY